MAQLLILGPLPNQLISVTVGVNGTTVSLNLRQYFNRIGGFWCLDIYKQNGVLLVASVPLITGDWPAANIMSPYDYLGIGQWFVINQNGAQTDFPNAQNLGTGFVILIDDNVGSGSAPGFPDVPAVAASGNWSSNNVAGLAIVL